MTEMIDKKLDAIEIPRELHETCMNGITREKKMRAQRIRRFVTIAAVAACVFVLPGLANYMFGHFEDVYKGTAIVGQRMAQADADFRMSAEAIGDNVCISVAVINSEEIAYQYIDQLSLDCVLIVDDSGKAVYSAECVVGDIEDGIVNVTLEDVDIEPGNYTLIVPGMLGISKADAPLVICGSWQCDITIE